MEISITTKKKKAIKKLLNINDTELTTLIEKVVDDWIQNLVSTKYQINKTIDEMIDEINN